MIKSHILDGVALTKFLFWIKKINKKNITEYDAQKKLEIFRKKNNNYLFPSFNTIAGTGKNGAIVHYRATKKNTRKINKKDIFLCDSGGQYKYGTTDVTRTICFSKPKKSIKNIFTRVLKGHIAVAEANLDKYFNGKLVDILARKYLKQIGLNYSHGTGHGVGFFLNVHEGPHAISKFNKIRFKEGMVVSNEPGYYKKNKFGIRIENLIYVKRLKKKLSFENLTLAPIEKELINFKLLTKLEKNYLFNYNLNVYSKISKFLKKNEKKWLASFI
jgi:Xaa-Pro aminopeptidase